jgi:hypothetical protein
VTKILRKIHLYLALFLTPWILVYLLSTMAMNHRPTMESWFGKAPPEFQFERTLEYDRIFSEDTTRKQAADQILADLDMSGTSWVSGNLNDGQLVILRESPLVVRRFTFSPAAGTLTIERADFRLPTFLEEMHRRSGYSKSFLLDNLWAVTVDLVILAILFWGISGIWIWWELRKTRVWGAICLATGVGLFTFFMLMI